MFFFVHDINNRIKTPVKPSPTIKPVGKLDPTHATNSVTPHPQNTDAVYPSSPRVTLSTPNRSQSSTYTDGSITAEDIMSSPILTVEISSSVLETEALMDKFETKHLVITDSEGYIAGIASKEKITKQMLDYPEKLAINLKNLGQLYSTPPATPIEAVAGLMLNHRLDAILVMENEFAVGIITTTNFLELVAFKSSGIDTHS